MAKVTLNPVLETFSGKIGDLVFRRHGEQVVVARKPAGERSWTPGQLAHQDRFRLATVYGRAALADPATKALYEAKARERGVPVFALMIADFFTEPAVDEIDLSAYTGKAGEKIRIRAHDDFELTGVAVAIRRPDGQVLEQGAAVAGEDSVWQYTTSIALPAGQNVLIEVTATDRPGHKTTRSQAKA
jgi:hypothetical protein